MAERWQQWMPHDIDAWQGSANIQALSDLAYRAVHNLLLDMWKQPDCALPDDDRELAKRSRLAVRWPDCSVEVREYLTDRTDSGKLTHRVLLHKWNEAREVYEKRRTGANKTNRIRYGVAERDDSDTQSERTPLALTRARVNTTSTLHKQNTTETPISPEMVAQGVMQELCLAGRDLSVVLERICIMRLDAGDDATQLRDTLVSSHRDFVQAIREGKLRYAWGADKFFGGPYWTDSKLWPWKENGGSNGHENKWEAARRRIAQEDMDEAEADDDGGIEGSASPLT